MLETQTKLCVMESDFFKKKCFPENEPKIEFLKLLKNLGISFFWIWSIMKVCIIWYIPVQIPYQGKIYFLRYRPKWCQESDGSVFKSTISFEQNGEIAWFFVCWYKFMKNLSWFKIFGWLWSKMGVATLVMGL